MWSTPVRTRMTWLKVLALSEGASEPKWKKHRWSFSVFLSNVQSIPRLSLYNLMLSKHTTNEYKLSSRLFIQFGISISFGLPIFWFRLHRDNKYNAFYVYGGNIFQKWKQSSPWQRFSVDVGRIEKPTCNFRIRWASCGSLSHKATYCKFASPRFVSLRLKVSNYF